MRPSLPRRAVETVLMIAAGLSAAACDDRREGAIHVSVIGETLEMTNPYSGTLTEPQAVLLTNVAQGLVRFDAHGHIVPGLAERWNVSDDGLSYIFRLSAAEWPSGENVTAQQVARLLRRQVGAKSNNPLKDSLGAVDEIVAMTDRVIEIRLTAPRPNLLQILAQPSLAILRDGSGTGPFRLVETEEETAEQRSRRVLLVRDLESSDDEEEERREEVLLEASDARQAIALFLRGETDLVLGGSFADLPYARAAGVSRQSLRFDPASGLFGFVPARAGGPLADEELRGILSQAIDREAFVAALDVQGLMPRATLLEPGLDGTADPAPPDWASIPIGERRTAVAAAADRLFAGEEERPTIRIAVPEGPGGDLLLRRLAEDWAVLGIAVERAGEGAPADLKLVDSVAPSTSPAWFLRQFRCEEVAICIEDADTLLEAARAAPIAAQRAALLIEAARLMDQGHLFIPITAPIRWSLVSDSVHGFAGNRFARHPLMDLDERLTEERAQ